MRFARIFNVVFLFILLFIQSCGPKDGLMNARNNQKIVGSLLKLIEQNPRIGEASLKEIKNAANVQSTHEHIPSTASFLSIKHEGSYVSSHTSLATKMTTSTETTAHKEVKLKSMDKKVISKAQALIESALDNFDMMAWFDLAIKINGIRINEIRTMREKFPQDDKFMASDKFEKAFGNKEKGFDLTCTSFVENPYVKLNRAHVKQTLAYNKELLKSSLSGCKKIKAAKFARCLHDLNKYVSTMNKYATCEINSILDLMQTMKDAGINFEELDKSMTSCRMQDFKACGYVEQSYTKEKGAQINRPPF